MVTVGQKWAFYETNESSDGVVEIVLLVAWLLDYFLLRKRRKSGSKSGFYDQQIWYGYMVAGKEKFLLKM